MHTLSMQDMTREELLSLRLEIETEYREVKEKLTNAKSDAYTRKRYLSPSVYQQLNSDVEHLKTRMGEVSTALALIKRRHGLGPVPLDNKTSCALAATVDHVLRLEQRVALANQIVELAYKLLPNDAPPGQEERFAELDRLVAVWDGEPAG